MKYFTEQEFQGFFPKLHPALPEKLDLLREKWGHPIGISTAPGAVGREYGAGYHNYIKHGSVMAVDTIPTNLLTVGDLRSFIDLAASVGFLGIGFYPFWRPAPGIHLDIGDEGHPRRWSGLPDPHAKGEQLYKSLGDGIDAWINRAR